MKKTLEQRRFRITWDDSGPFLLPVVPAQQFDRSQSQARTCRPCVHSILCCNNFRSTAPAFYGWSAPRSPRVGVPLPGCRFDESYERGCQEKMLLGAVLGRGSGVHPAQCLFRRDFEFAECCERTGRPPVCTRRFHNEMVVDGHGSGSYASRRVGFSVPTMVLFETQGL